MSGPADGLALAVARDGWIVGVRAKPRARRDAITGLRDGDLLVETTQPPEAGAANEAIRRLLADALGVRRDGVALTAGAASRRKRFKVTGVDVATARDRFAPWLRTSSDRGRR